LVGEVEAVPAHCLKCAASQCLLDWGIFMRRCHRSDHLFTRGPTLLAGTPAVPVYLNSIGVPVAMRA